MPRWTTPGHAWAIHPRAPAAGIQDQIVRPGMPSALPGPNPPVKRAYASSSGEAPGGVRGMGDGLHMAAQRHPVAHSSERILIDPSRRRVSGHFAPAHSTGALRPDRPSVGRHLQ